MRHQIRRTREHIESHNLIANAPRYARQMRIAEVLLSRLIDEPYYEIASARYPQRGRAWAEMITALGKQDSALLGRLIGKHLRSWWD